MFGSIMPEPLATQVIVASPTRSDSALGCVSVVMMPSAPTIGSPAGRARHPATPRSMISIGSGTPITPVELTSTLSGVVPDFGRGGGSHAPRVLEPLLAGGDVADLAVGDDRAQPSAADRLAAEDDRRARETGCA